MLCYHSRTVCSFTHQLDVVCFLQICTNDDLVAKNMAFYIRESAGGGGGGQDELDKLPVMLSSRIFTQTVFPTWNKPTARTQPPAGKLVFLLL